MTLPSIASPSELISFMDDPLHTLLRIARRHGDLVKLDLGRRSFFLANHPELVRRVLTLDHQKVGKMPEMKKVRGFFGAGLINNEGDDHLRQRRQMMPSFLRPRMERFDEVIARRVELFLDGWTAGSTIDLYQVMRRLVMAILVEVVLGRDVTDFPELSEAPPRPPSPFVRSEAAAQPSLLQRMMRILGRGGPSTSDRDQRFDAAITRLLSEPLAEQSVIADLAPLMSAERLRDEVVTLLVAGAETTASALTFPWWCVDRHPEAWDMLDDAEGTRRVFNESLRLYPPVWRAGRFVLSEVRLGDSIIPPGSGIWVSQWVSHRDPRFFPEPDVFRPSRFSPEEEAGRPRFAFFPFGGSHRSCMGEQLAQTIGHTVLAQVARRWRLRWLRPGPLELLAHFTLLPRGDVPVRVETRP